METATNTITLDIDKKLFDTYIFYTAVLILKTLVMIPVVGLSRVRYNALANPEDAKNIGFKVNRNHDVVERNRRAHLNDLENVPFFIMICFLYIAVTNPSVYHTTWLIRIYTISRIAHSVAYVWFQSVLRVAIYQIQIFIKFYMTICVILHYL